MSKTYVVVMLKKSNKGEIARYYNVVEDSWDREFSEECAIVDKKEAERIEEDLDIVGVILLGGQMG